MLRLAEMIAAEVGYKPRVCGTLARQGSSNRRVALSDEAVGWRAVTTLEEGIHKAFEFFKARGRI
jgi:nucleoside-diphosphate-sugar epimerase